MTIRRRIAVGGMAELFLADRALPSGTGSEPVVVKRALPGADATFLEMLGRERDALAHISSAYVVELLGGAEDWLILEFVDGSDLGALISHQAKRGKSLSLSAALWVVDGLLRGLADLHDATDADGRALGLVHRDINPSNVLIGRDGAVKLADLGVVHTSLAEQPTVGGLKGTLAYMAPEQLLGQALDRRADIYAAGLVAYEALTGVAARPGGMVGLAELLEARRSLPAPPSSLRPHIPAALDAAVLAALAPEPANRPADARTWLQAIQSAAGAPASRPDLAAVAVAVQRPVASPTRTLAPSTGPRPVPALSPPREADASVAPLAEPRSRVPTWVGAILVGGLGLVLILLVGELYSEDSSGAPPAAGAPATVAPSPSVQPRVRARPMVVTAGRRGRAGPALSVARRASRRAAAGPQPRPPLALASARSSTPHSKVRAPKPRTPHVAPARMVVAIRRVGAGQLYVSGGGKNAFNDFSSGELGQGGHRFALRGPGKARAIVFLSRRGDKLAARIGAPRGTSWDSVVCGGRALGATPSGWTSVGARVVCRLTRDEARRRTLRGSAAGPQVRAPGDARGSPPLPEKLTRDEATLSFALSRVTR